MQVKELLQDVVICYEKLKLYDDDFRCHVKLVHNGFLIEGVLEGEIGILFKSNIVTWEDLEDDNRALEKALKELYSSLCKDTKIK